MKVKKESMTLERVTYFFDMESVLIALRFWLEEKKDTYLPDNATVITPKDGSVVVQAEYITSRDVNVDVTPPTS